MFKNLTVSACLVLSLSTISHARIIQCIDERGHSYFTDTRCPRQQLKSNRLENSQPGNGVSGLIVNKPGNSKRLEFYCNPGKGKFVRCE
jgi:hypothetical protein